MKLSLMRIAAILMIFAMQVYGQADLDNLNLDFAGGGARAEGMGKAFIGISDDVTGGSWNPAGIYNYDSPILGFSEGMLVPRGTTNSYFGNNVTEVTHSGSFNNISSMNFVAPVRIKGHKFVGTVNYTRSYDEFTSETFTYYRTLSGIVVKPRFIDVEIENLDTANVGRWDFYEERQGGLNTFSLGFGTRIYNNYSFGLTANIYTGRMITQYYDIDSLFNVRHLDLSFDQMALFVFEYNSLDSHSFSGMNFNIGFKYSGEKLSAGLLIRRPPQNTESAVNENEGHA